MKYILCLHVIYCYFTIKSISSNFSLILSKTICLLFNIHNVHVSDKASNMICCSLRTRRVDFQYLFRCKNTSLTFHTVLKLTVTVRRYKLWLQLEWDVNEQVLS